MYALAAITRAKPRSTSSAISACCAARSTSGIGAALIGPRLRPQEAGTCGCCRHGISDLFPPSAVGHRPGHRRERAHRAGAAAPVGERCGPRGDALDEVVALGLQRLAQGDPRDANVSLPDAGAEGSKGVDEAG